MKRRNPFIGIWLLSVAALGIFTFYSFAGDPIKNIKQSDAAEYARPLFDYVKRLILRDTVVVDTLVNPLKPVPVGVDTVVAESKPEHVVDSSSQSILLIGDSMLEGLSPRFYEYALHNGHDFNAVVWYSSTTKYFGECDTLRYFIEKYKPTYILLSLGSNELFMPGIKKNRQKFVEHILKQIDTIPYLWIGPPNWKEDTGINDMIIENAGYDRYYPSKRLTYNRAKDGAHPTRESSSKWADSVGRYITDSSAYRIRFEMPDTAVKRRDNGIRVILKPLR